MKNVRIGIIGAGRIGRVHAQSISYYVPNAEVVAISDVFIQAAEEVAKTFGIAQCTDDYHDILKNPDVDAVLICSPTNTHADISIEAAQAGKHIFCEKPVDLTPQKILAVKKAVEKAHVKLQTGFNRRFDHNHRRIQELCASGALGDVRIVKITSRDPAPPPMEYVKVSGGLFLDMTIHDFDMARFQAGSEVEEVSTVSAVLVDPAIGQAGDVDTAVITLRFKNGALGVIDNCREAVYGYDQRVEVLGSKGAAATDNDTDTRVNVFTVEGVCSDKPQYFFLERYMDSFAEEMRQFVEAVAENKETPVGLEDGLQSVLIALAAKRSLEEGGRPVKVSEIKY